MLCTNGFIPSLQIGLTENINWFRQSQLSLPIVWYLADLSRNLILIMYDISFNLTLVIRYVTVASDSALLAFTVRELRFTRYGLLYEYRSRRTLADHSD